MHGVFIPLTELTKIPDGTIINALHGTLTFITAVPGGTQHTTLSPDAKHKKKPKTKTQTGKFGRAVFKVTQARSGPNKGLATLSLVEGAFKGAPSFASCKTTKRKAVTAALSKKTLQLQRQRPWEVPHQGPLRGRDRPRHDLDDRRPLRRHADPRHQGHGHGQRLRPPQDDHPPARSQLPGPGETGA